jgi:hypothetical protein
LLSPHNGGKNSVHVIKVWFFPRHVLDKNAGGGSNPGMNGPEGGIAAYSSLATIRRVSSVRPHGKKDRAIRFQVVGAAGHGVPNRACFKDDHAHGKPTTLADRRVYLLINAKTHNCTFTSLDGLNLKK